MIEELGSIRSGTRELRRFGVVVGMVFGLLGGLLTWRGKDFGVYFLAVFAVLLLLGLALPKVLRPLHKAWMTLAMVMGWFMTRVILHLLFYLVVTPTALLGRLFGKQFLDLRFDGKADSYWIPKESVATDRRDHERQF